MVRRTGRTFARHRRACPPNGTVRRPLPNPRTRATMFSNPAAPRALFRWVLDPAAAPPFAAHRRTTAEEHDAANHEPAATRGADTPPHPPAGIRRLRHLGSGHPGARDARDRGALRDPVARPSRR